ncbi:MAG: hypothetical protein GEU96_11145 [Propionibacteriales bacterium]|nr:hypothetical protein [Propionibacteriales bacterium]
MSAGTNTVIPAGPNRAGEREPVVVRRRAAISASIGLTAALLGALYLWRAVGDGGTAQWAVGGVLVLLAGYHLVEWIDARIPLLVADEIGIRLRIDDEWHGLVWTDVDRVTVEPRGGLLHDGHVAVQPVDASVTEGLGVRRQRLFAGNVKRYGAPYVTVLGLTTIASTDDLAWELARRADGRADVQGPAVEEPRDESPADEAPADEGPADQGPPDDEAPVSDTTPTGDESAAESVADSVDESADDLVADPTPAVAPAADPILDTDVRASLETPAMGDADAPAVRALRMVRRALRAEVTRRPHTAGSTSAPSTVGTLALDQHADTQANSDANQKPRVDRARVRGNMSLVLDEPVDTTVAEAEPEPEPAPAPVPVGFIGPKLSAARVRLGMTVDDLATRTRIRSHVIEAIEVDDFTPCGGDFYARGHLAAMCRVLGLDRAPVIDEFEQRYAAAPINARTVFEAELATGSSGAIRGVGSGGPNWLALVGTVLVLLMIWGVASYVTDGEEPSDADASSLTEGSGGLTAPTRERAVEKEAVVRLVAKGGDTSVVARTGDGEVVFQGRLDEGQTRWVRSGRAMRVRVSNGGVVVAKVNDEPGAKVAWSNRPVTIDVPAKAPESD